MYEKPTDPRILKIRDLVIDRVLENLQSDSPKSKQASLLGVALGLLKSHGSPSDLKSEEEIKEQAGLVWGDNVKYRIQPKLFTPTPLEQSDDDDESDE